MKDPIAWLRRRLDFSVDDGETETIRSYDVYVRDARIRGSMKTSNSIYGGAMSATDQVLDSLEAMLEGRQPNPLAMMESPDIMYNAFHPPSDSPPPYRSLSVDS